MFNGSTVAEAETPIVWPPRAKSLEKSLMLGKTEGRMRRGQQKMRWLDSWMASLIQWTKTWANFQEVVRDRKA